MTWKGVVFGMGLVISGCDGGPTVPKEAEPLFGSWEWVRATGGVGGMTRTPQTEGFRRTLLFSRPDRVVLRQDGVPVVETTFEVIRETRGGVPTTVLAYQVPVLGQTRHAFDAGPILLLLTDECCDGFEYEFARVLPE